jgi:hypothetical protein
MFSKRMNNPLKPLAGCAAYPILIVSWAQSAGPITDIIALFIKKLLRYYTVLPHRMGLAMQTNERPG